MTEKDIHGLYCHPQIDSYITTTHGEGFGLPLFEAAYYGMPVCAPGWSGHLDFLKMPKGRKYQSMYEKIKTEINEVKEECYMENIILPGMKWSYVSEKDTRKAMRNMYQAKSAKRSIAKKLQEYLREEFSEENQFNKITDTCLSVYKEKTGWAEKNNEIKIF